MTEDGRTYREGDNMTLSGDQVPRSADVVIVASQRSCNGDIKDLLPKVVTQINKAMTAEGLNNNRFRYLVDSKVLTRTPRTFTAAMTPKPQSRITSSSARCFEMAIQRS